MALEVGHLCVEADREGVGRVRQLAAWRRSVWLEFW